MDHPVISIITPSFNQAAYIEQTIESVLSQGYPRLEYIIIDGGSTDGSVDIIRRYEKHLTYWESKRDRGQWEAINNGFARSSGSLMGFVNSDDTLEPGSLAVLGGLPDNNPAWWVGAATWRSEKGDSRTPNPEDVKSVGYWDLLLSRQPIVCQVATFWTRSMWSITGACVKELHMALDFELWMRFSRICRGRPINRVMGTYLSHAAAKTTMAMDAYQKECDDIRRAEWRRHRWPKWLRHATQNIGSRVVHYRYGTWRSLVYRQVSEYL